MCSGLCDSLRMHIQFVVVLCLFFTPRLLNVMVQVNVSGVLHSFKLWLWLVIVWLWLVIW